ncbi:TYRO protein tyrosine kinase-binding protein [Pelodytes ibericus]
MEPQSPPYVLFLFLTTLGGVHGQDVCGDCLRLDSGAIIGIVICDVIITLLIALTVYCISSKIQKKKHEERKKASQKTELEENEQTYEELQGQRTDIYNDLGRARN